MKSILKFLNSEAPWWVLPVGIVLILVVGLCLPAEKRPQCHVREYQIELTRDSIIVYDLDRLVGRALYDTSKLDSIILNDNK